MLRVLRMRRQWTQAETARAANLPQSVIVKWERGDDWPTLERLHTLCFVLGATPEETAILSRGRCLPSQITDFSCDADAVHYLSLRKTDIAGWLSAGNYDAAQLALLPLEADAWRLARRAPTDAAKTLLLDTMNLSLLCDGTRYGVDVSHAVSLLRRADAYCRALNAEAHPVALTGRIIALQMRRNVRNLTQTRPPYTQNADDLLALLADCSDANNGAEFRSWIYMEAASNVSSLKTPDPLVVERLIRAGFDEPHRDNIAREDDPTAARYAAMCLGRVGRITQAGHYLDHIMTNTRQTVRSHMVYARIYWANNDRAAAETHLALADAAIAADKGAGDLADDVHDLRGVLVAECGKNPRLALR